MVENKIPDWNSWVWYPPHTASLVQAELTNMTAEKIYTKESGETVTVFYGSKGYFVYAFEKEKAEKICRALEISQFENLEGKVVQAYVHGSRLLGFCLKTYS